MKQSRVEQLQFLRFICFLLICLWHGRIYVPTWFPQSNGSANAVCFFFILSGFLSAYSSQSKGNESEIKLSIFNEIKYVWKKITKVYPLYFATTIYMVIYSDIPYGVANHQFDELKGSFFQLGRNLLLIQSWFPNGWYSFNGVGWFLSTIMFLYVINLPMKSLFIRISKTKRAILYYAFVLITSYVLCLIYCYLMRNTNIEYTIYILPVGRIWEYIGGMALGYLAYALKPVVKNKIGNEVALSIIEVTALIIWIYNMYRYVEGWNSLITHWYIPNCLLILVFCCFEGGYQREYQQNHLFFWEISLLNAF